MRSSSSVEGLNGVNGLMDYSTTSGRSSSTLSWLKGSHSLRMGPEYRIYKENNLVSQFAPTLDFSTTWTRGPFDNSTAAPYGQELASFLMGYLTGGSSRINPPRDEQIWRMGVFLQDDWKVTSEPHLEPRRPLRVRGAAHRGLRRDGERLRLHDAAVDRADG